MKKRKSNMVFIIVISLLLLISGVGIYQHFTGDSKVPQDNSTASSLTPSSSSEVASETTDEKNYRTAKLKLEHPYTEADASAKAAVSQAFDVAINAINEARQVPNIKGTYDNQLMMTSEAMVQTFAMALLVNHYQYQGNQLEVTQAENDDVVQFLVVLTKENEDNCYFIGNFNTTVNQIQLKAYVGGNIGATFG
ncbi:hypothetical protein [Streptococcus gallolyticus]|uniref:hypothetical protein n=1 Tax=Streptococcus gallolyticus TaxID=315405 RepID=UPI000210BBD3|nr:hypothetical protein [Streptococcus gallolyticus]BAK29010.1 signal peptide containing protein [Streptococcus gallolyticus subsp. gallolyticus ATCC 43143]